MKDRTVNGYTFEYDNEDKFYSCRGELEYDEEHDEIPEEGLWIAAHVLKDKLLKEGYKSDVEHSEKGWVEVNIYID